MRLPVKLPRVKLRALPQSSASFRPAVPVASIPAARYATGAERHGTTLQYDLQYNDLTIQSTTKHKGRGSMFKSCAGLVALSSLLLSGVVGAQEKIRVGVTATL